MAAPAACTDTNHIGLPTLFCKKDNKQICDTCIALHLSHDIINIKECLKEEDINNFLNNVVKAKGDVQKLLEELFQELTRVEDKKKLRDESIKAMIAEVHRTLLDETPLHPYWRVSEDLNIFIEEAKKFFAYFAEKENMTKKILVCFKDPKADRMVVVKEFEMVTKMDKYEFVAKKDALIKAIKDIPTEIRLERLRKEFVACVKNAGYTKSMARH